jgi:phage tail-like protein
MPTEAQVTIYWGLEIDGGIKGFFTEVGGLDSEHEVVEHRVSDDKGNAVIQKIPGNIKYSNIVLRRGITDDRSLHDWRQEIIDGKVESARKNGSIVMYGPDMSERVRYNFERGWPCKLKGPSLDAKKNEVAVEELEICVEKCVRAK